MTSTILIEGGLLPHELLDRLATRPQEVAGQKAEDFGLARSTRVTDEIQDCFSSTLSHWRRFARQRAAASDVAGATPTRELWMLPFLRELGFEPKARRQAFIEGGRTYAISHVEGDDGAIPIHIAPFEQELSERGRERLSPHALVQEYLNRSDALWGIVTNGRKLRLLRDTTRISRAVFVEFDIEAIARQELFADYAILWRLMHRSRLPKDRGSAHECWLERWYQQAIEEGGRVRERLRDGVEEALKILGTGFLEHPANEALRAAFARGELDATGYWRQLLALVYRLLFLMTAEERRLLGRPDADGVRLAVYERWYSMERLRTRAEGRRRRDPHVDLWLGLVALFRALDEEEEASKLGLGVLDGDLFSAGACRDLEAALLANERLLEAVWHLSTFEETVGHLSTSEETKGRRRRGVRRRVRYAGLDVEELGSVYESLLDYHPVVEPEGRRFELGAGTERKRTGSYYTPDALVQELIRSALDPVIEERLEEARREGRSPEDALLSLRVVDPAAGSGHFLLAAARRIGRRLAEVRSGEPEPPPDVRRQAERDVIRHCVHAVDSNPLAVDLCKVSLWIEGQVAGEPLSFLDHRVRRGDSLIGVFDLGVLADGIPDEAFRALTGDDQAVAKELAKRNRAEREPDTLFRFDATEELRDLDARLREITAMPEDGIEAVRRKKEAYEAFRQSNEFERLKLACDLWCAVFFAPKTKETEKKVPTTRHLWEALQDPARVPGDMRALAEDLAHRLGFFHWPLEFPDAMAAGGFHVVLGNPPWDVLQLNEQEFFATRAPDIAALSGARRKTAIAALGHERPELWKEYLDSLHRIEANNEFIRSCGRFPLTASGKLNPYALFAELASGLHRPDGRAGMVVPTGIATDSSTSRFFASVSTDGRLAGLFDFENRERIFPAVDSRQKFCLLTLAREVPQASFAFYLTRTQQLDDGRRRFTLSPEDIARINPNTKTAPVFRSRADAELTKAIYARVPVLIDEGRGEAGNPWRVTFRQGLFNMTGDSHLFRTWRELEEAGAERRGTDWVEPGGEVWLPLYEAKMIHQFDHRFATYGPDGEATRNASDTEKADPDYEPVPRYWVNEREVLARTARVPRPVAGAWLTLHQAADSEQAQDAWAALWFALAAWVAGELFRRVLGRSPAPGVYSRSVARQVERHLNTDYPACAAALSAAGVLGDKVVKPFADWARRDARTPLSDEALSALRRYAAQEPGDARDRALLAELDAWMDALAPSWLMGWRDICRATDERTVIASVLPRVGVGHTVPLLFLDAPSTHHTVAHLGNWCSIVLDFIARQKVGGTHLTYFYVSQFPVLPPSVYAREDLTFLVPRVLELAYTSRAMEPFARDLGYDGPPFRWVPERRAILRAELDAYYAYLYGLGRKQLRYILDPADLTPGELEDILDPAEEVEDPLDPEGYRRRCETSDWPSETFRVLRQNEIRAFGEYRTRRLVLEAWERFVADGTFDLSRLQDDPRRIAPLLRQRLVELRQRVAKEAAADEPVLFVEGASDIPILEAAWRALFPGEALPVRLVAAGGTQQMRSLAGRGRALRELLGDRPVFALADNDHAGRELWDNGHFRKGGRFVLHENGIRWAALPPPAEFVAAMEAFGIPKAYWPLTVEQMFPPDVRLRAMREGAYATGSAPFTDLLSEVGLGKRIVALLHELPPDDPRRLWLLEPDPAKKEAFAAWLARRAADESGIFEPFRSLFESLRQELAREARAKATGGD